MKMALSLSALFVFIAGAPASYAGCGCEFQTSSEYCQKICDNHNDAQCMVDYRDRCRAVNRFHPDAKECKQACWNLSLYYCCKLPD